MHEQQSADDILNVEGNKAVVIENNTNDDEETDNDLQEEQLTGDALPCVVQIENLENHIYQCAPGENNIPKYILLDEDFEVLVFPDSFHMMKEDIIQNEVQNYQYESTSNSVC